jgi:hypothetical protein
VKASFAPALCHACAMAHAMERLFATPKTIPVFPASNDISCESSEFDVRHSAPNRFKLKTEKPLLTNFYFVEPGK